MKVRLEYKLVHPKAKLPTRANLHDAASDLYAVESKVVAPGKTENIETGLILSAPPGHYITINGRSSLNKRGILAFRGIVDSGYLGTMKISLTNTTDELYEVKAGDRVGQFTLHKCLEYDAVEVEEFSPEYSTRGTKGFGSSGR
jgi:dUTP pyrophosphatase